MESTSSSGSSRRTRPPTSSPQLPSCSVDGCAADLSRCREYHRRHKVCEVHSKTPRVTIGGQEMRFCQQCSRFHSLAEFDEGKRSCRKRLDGHNRRRRKTRPGSFPIRSEGLLSPLQGSIYLEFGSLPTFSAWTTKSEATISDNPPLFGFGHQGPVTLPSQYHYDFDNRFGCIQAGPRCADAESSRALSLLSSSQRSQTTAQEVVGMMSNAVQHDPVLVSGTSHGVSNVGLNRLLRFGHESDGPPSSSASHESNHTTSFSWG